MAIDYRRRPPRAATAARERDGDRADRALEPAARLVILLATLAGVALAARLGFWQLDRAAQKIALQASLETRARDAAARRRRRSRATPPRPPRSTIAAVALRGRWLAERTVFLDNRQMDGKAGFFVVTPLRSTAGAERGARAARLGAAQLRRPRTLLPPVPTPDRAGDGRRASSPRRRRGCSSSTRAASGPIRQNLDLAAVRARDRARRCCRSRVLQDATEAPPPTGCARHWPAPAVDVQKHYGYAFQWFALAALHRRPLCLVPIHPPRASAVTRALLVSFTRALAAVAGATPRVAAPHRRAAAGRCSLVLLVCAAPVVASYFAYFVVRPGGAHQLQRADRADRGRCRPRCRWPISTARAVAPPSLHGPVAARRRRRRRLRCRAASGTCGCSASCARRSAREQDRVDKVWLIDDAAPPRAETLARSPRRATAPRSRRRPCCACRAPRCAAGSQPAPGRALEDHLYLVDPRATG